MSDQPQNPFEQIKGIAGEHYDNYVIIVLHPDTHELEYAYDNQYAARGMTEMVTSELKATNEASNVDFGWEEAFDEEDDSETDLF